MSGDVIVYRKRRNIELVGIIFAILIGAGATIITHLFRDGALPKTIIYFCIAWIVICLGAHLSVRKFASFADPAVLPIVLTLNGLGLAMIHRLDMSLSTSQALSQFIWTIAGQVLHFLGAGFLQLVEFVPKQFVIYPVIESNFFLVSANEITTIDEVFTNGVSADSN